MNEIRIQDENNYLQPILGLVVQSFESLFEDPNNPGDYVEIKAIYEDEPVVIAFARREKAEELDELLTRYFI